ncbi:MAG: hypothetical protein RLZZ188_1435 [Verrucomicrobiota bacterium]
MSGGISFRGVIIGAGVLILFTGVWLRVSQEGYRMDAEEAIKDNKISADAASLLVENRRRAGSVAVLAGIVVSLLGLLG